MYVPSKPYVIQSGKREGQVLENLAFSHYDYLVWQLRKCRERGTSGHKNALQERLEWLILRGENRQTKMLCPYCGERLVTRFSLLQRREGSSTDLHFICCDQEKCQDEIRAQSPDQEPVFLPFKFSSLLEIWSRGDRRLVAQMFRDVFGLPKPLTREAAFQFFKEEVKSDKPIIWHKEQTAFTL